MSGSYVIHPGGWIKCAPLRNKAFRGTGVCEFCGKGTAGTMLYHLDTSRCRCLSCCTVSHLWKLRDMGHEHLQPLETPFRFRKRTPPSDYLDDPA